ncbi:MAG TPA: serine hydrolase [Oscillospiraceae bacterium]|nr:serine hydrolase [Oscillospiraceae bacterium]HPS35952.1 serine hydrolase [Oscillospiraceae bacterium]
MKTFKKITPERAGLPSRNMMGFLRELDSAELAMHSVILMRGDRVFGEYYAAPFKAEDKHRMYSVSKTFVSMAIGALIGEGKLSLDDKIISFFSDKLPGQVHPHIVDATVRDLLRMATPFDDVTYYLGAKDWAATFFNTPTSHPAGTLFKYDSSASYILDVIVERLTGMTFLEYLKKKALSRIGFSEDTFCIKAPEGYSWGASGVICTPMDLARFARLVMKGGLWEGEQLLPADYIRAATSKQIDNRTDGHNRPDQSQGYGYQVWMTREGSYSFIGMGSQLAVSIPQKDLLFVCTGDTQGNELGYLTIYNALWKHIVNPAGAALAENPAEHAELEKYASNRSIPVVPGDKTSLLSGQIGSVEYIMEKNPMGIKRLKIELSDDEGVFCYTNERGNKQLRFGLGHFVLGGFPETHYFGETIGKPVGRPYRCAASGAWVSPDTLRIKVDIIDDYLGNVCINLCFKGNELVLRMEKTAEWFLDEYVGFASGRR